MGMTLETLLQTDILVFISYRTRTKWEKQFFLCGRNINYTNGRQQQPAAVPAWARPIGKDKTEVKNTQLVLYNFTVAKKFLFTQEERICRELLRILRVLHSSLLCPRSICPQGPQLSG